MNFFVSQYFLISVSSVAKSGFFFFWPSGWCLPTKTIKITACNASLSGNQSAQPPPRGYSSEGDSGGTLSEGQQMRFCCWGKLFPEPYNMCHISCLNCCHWAEERQQKRFEGMDIEELGSKDTQVGRKFQEARQLWHCNSRACHEPEPRRLYFQRKIHCPLPALFHPSCTSPGTAWTTQKWRTDMDRLRSHRIITCIILIY